VTGGDALQASTAVPFDEMAKAGFQSSAFDHDHQWSKKYPAEQAGNDLPCFSLAQFIMPSQSNSKTRPTIEVATMTELKQKYDASTVAVLRQALNEVVADRRFLVRKSVTPLEMAEHILQRAASGERDLHRLKSSAFDKLGATA
jgi:hypothetical protein